MLPHKENLCYNGCKISFVTINALVRNVFCRNLRTFVWRKICQKIFYVEKKWQIWGLHKGDGDGDRYHKDDGNVDHNDKDGGDVDHDIN